MGYPANMVPEKVPFRIDDMALIVAIYHFGSQIIIDDDVGARHYIEDDEFSGGRLPVVDDILCLHEGQITAYIDNRLDESNGLSG